MGRGREFSCRVDDRVEWEMLTSGGKFKVFCGHGLWIYISHLWIIVAGVGMRCDGGFDFGFCRFPARGPNVKKLSDKTPRV